MSLKEIVRQKLLNEVIKYQAPVQTQHNPAAPLRPGRKIEWRVLVVDNLSMRMVSSCCKMHEISNERITLVENINKSREPLSNMDAVYLITPTEPSIKSLLRDFENTHSPMYRYAHVFFTQAVPDELFRLISSQKEFVKKYLKTCKEVNIAFIPYEEKVFSLGSPATFQYLYSPGLAWNRAKHIERIAEQIATVCATLGEYPMIRYRAAGYSNLDLAVAVQHKLDGYKVDEPTLGEGPEKSRSQLLILDRGFDCVSPLLHELTLQAMAYDLLEIENDVYTYTPGPNSPTKEVLLDEGDELWMQLRHKHIVHVNKIVASNLKRFNDSNPMVLADKASIQDLSLMIKKMPQHQKQFTKYATHFHLAEDCMKSQNYVHKLCRIEQDLAMGYDAKGEKIKDHLSNIVPILLDQSIDNNDKVRIIALYVMAKNGVSEENLSKLFMHAGLCPKEQAIVRNLNYLGVNVFGTNRNDVYTVPRKDHITDQTLQVSRWTPVIKDVMEDCIDDTLDKRYFPFLSRRLSNSTYQVPVSARYGTWRSAKGSAATKNLPRLIIFVVGGISMSEMRCAYEVTRERKTWEVIVGASEILTPAAFMSNLGNLHE